MDLNEAILRSEISDKLREFYRLKKENEKFIPGKTRIPYASAVFDHEEVINMVNAILDGWFGVRNQAEKFENKLSNFLGTRASMVTNSGSSANLIAVSTLSSSILTERDPLKPSDEVITPATTFPTTTNPIYQNGLTPVFMDSRLETLNLNPEGLRAALSPKTRAIMIPHMVGIPNELDTIMEFAEDNNLYLIEDTCDALGSKYDGRYLGTFGDIGTFSFYAAHHISMGEGGAVTSNDDELIQAARSIRDWGRALDIKRQPDHLRGDELPEDYDLRYVYVTMGYNLKPTEIQAAKGVVQLDRIMEFMRRRRNNYATLLEGVKEYEEYFHFAEPPEKSEVSWFCFPLTVDEDAPFSRRQLVDWLDRHGIDTRMMLAGNILRHPVYTNMRYRVVAPLKISDYILCNSFFMGVHPALREEHIEYMLDVIKNFMKQHH